MYTRLWKLITKHMEENSRMAVFLTSAMLINLPTRHPWRWLQTLPMPTTPCSSTAGPGWAKPIYCWPSAQRSINLGWMLSQRHLSPFDLLIGFIGEPGSGKSSLVRGMFPGLELASDDEGVNVRPLPLLNRDGRGFRDSHTYHLDVRFEMAFTQVYDLAQAVRTAVEEGKRVVVEHFELLYPYLGINWSGRPLAASLPWKGLWWPPAVGRSPSPTTGKRPKSTPWWSFWTRTSLPVTTGSRILTGPLSGAAPPSSWKSCFAPGTPSIKPTATGRWTPPPCLPRW